MKEKYKKFINVHLISLIRTIGKNFNFEEIEIFSIQMNIKAINLDFYGTLVDWLHIWINVSEHIVKENNLKIICWINRLNEKRLPDTPEPKFEIKKLDEIFKIL